MPLPEDYYEQPLEEGTDYYLSPQGFRVMTTHFHEKRGYCCGNVCRHCPYFPKHQKGNRMLRGCDEIS